ncbi:DUF6049 family protein [uncultured Cellulomonas sp.]|uniref:DUF6049 family protein n=1 Tax=uncultured Cellulomonas sp. TaxID=189682 RepID=UPI002631DF94|nr:DUF6049 family protein [uncultured Cellulomonas sp.]
MTARRHPHPTRPAAALPVVLGALCALLGVLGAGLLGPLAVPAAASTTPSPGPGRSAAAGPRDGAAGDLAEEGDEADDGAAELRITQVSPQVVRPADELVVRATVRNDTDDTLKSPQVSLRISRFLQSTRSSLERWADLPLDGTAGTPLEPTQSLGPLAPGQSAEVELRVPASDLRLSTADSAWGPRGISVVLADGGRREAVVRTFLVWRPTEEPVTPTRLSVLVPITGGPVDPTATTGPTGDGTDPGEAATAVVGAPTADDVDRLDAALQATAGRPGVTWAVDPALLAAARAAADGSPARRWVDALTEQATGREVVALPAGDPDVAALAHADSAAADALLADAVTAAAGTQDPVLGATGATGLAWPAGVSPDVDTAILAARTGATSLVVDGAALPPEELTYTPTGRASVATTDGTLAALVTDPVLTAQLEDPTGTTAATAAQRVLAETAVVTRERPNDGRHLLVAVDRGWAPDPAVAAAQLAALDAAPWVELSDVSTLAATVDPEVDRPALPARAVSEAEIAPGDVAALQRARAELAGFAAIVPDPAALLTGVDEAVRAPLSVAWRDDPVQRSGVVDDVVADLAARRSGVSVVTGSDLSLISQTGLFPLGLRNELSQEVTVQVAVDPASPLLVIDGAQTVTIPPSSEMQVRVPFRAVGSGDVRVAVSLLTPGGAPLGPPQQFTVRVHADWENVGTAVVAGLLGIALVVGIIRTIRRGQTAKRGPGAVPVSELARLPEESS